MVEDVEAIEAESYRKGDSDRKLERGPDGKELGREADRPETDPRRPAKPGNVILLASKVV